MSINLPEKFIKRMQEMLGPEEFEKYLESLEVPAKSGIRLNGLKLNGESFKTISPFSLSEVPWIDNAYYYAADDQPTKHPYYYAGLYYVQEPSAMTPAFLFDVNPGDKVLDLCAAPGGKSTALGAKLKGRGVLVSNDVSNSRAKALLKNIELFGISNAVVVSETSDRLAERFEGYFDKILVDAPCSGEGMFRKQNKITENWEQYGTGYYAKLQRQILPDAVKMLADGGHLLYSTCTFSPEEDEETVVWLLEKFPELELVDLIPVDKKAHYEKLGFDHGRNEWLENKSDADLSKCIRLFPHKLDGEGHFIAEFVLNRTGNNDIIGNMKSSKATMKSGSKQKLPEELTEFLGHVKMDIDYDNITIKDGWVTLTPEGIPNLKGLRILREGLLLGEIKKDRFEPSQALAMALKASEYDNVYNLSKDNPDVVRYLKCESIELPDDVKDGYVLVCVNGYPLGFGKKKKGSFKNKYLPGWRMM